MKKLSILYKERIDGNNAAVCAGSNIIKSKKLYSAVSRIACPWKIFKIYFPLYAKNRAIKTRVVNILKFFTLYSEKIKNATI